MSERQRPSVVQADVPPAVVAPAPVVGTFSPRTDAPYRYRIEQQRDDAGERRRFTLERRLTFTRDGDGDGYIAELVTIATTGESLSAATAMFEDAMATFGDTPIRFRIDRHGAIVAIDDLPALWTRLSDAVAGAATRTRTSGERRQIAARIAASLQMLPPDRRQSMFASMLQPVLGSDLLRQGVGPARPVRVAGRPPLPRDTMLEGVERSWLADGALVLERRVAGDVAAPPITGADTPPAAGRVEMTVLRRVDAGSGLLRRQHETALTTIAGQRAETVTITTLTIDR